jgi:hypothetical protein
MKIGSKQRISVISAKTLSNGNGMARGACAYRGDRGAWRQSWQSVAANENNHGVSKIIIKENNNNEKPAKSSTKA